MPLFESDHTPQVYLTVGSFVYTLRKSFLRNVEIKCSLPTFERKTVFDCFIVITLFLKTFFKLNVSCILRFSPNELDYLVKFFENK